MQCLSLLFSTMKLTLSERHMSRLASFWFSLTFLRQLKGLAKFTVLACGKQWCNNREHYSYPLNTTDVCFLLIYICPRILQYLRAILMHTENQWLQKASPATMQPPVCYLRGRESLKNGIRDLHCPTPFWEGSLILLSENTMCRLNLESITS